MVLMETNWNDGSTTYEIHENCVAHYVDKATFDKAKFNVFNRIGGIHETSDGIIKIMICDVLDTPYNRKAIKECLQNATHTYDMLGGDL